jgi:hypothetical protein
MKASGEEDVWIHIFFTLALVFFNSPFYFQSVPMHSANVVKSCTKACKRVLISTLLYLIGSVSSCDLGSVTYKLSLKNHIYYYNNYILNLVGRSTGKFFRNRLVSGGSCRFTITVDSQLSARGLTALRLNRGNVFLKKKFYFP